MSYEKGITTVDEESLIGFLHQNKDRVTAEYIDTLEDLCIEKQISVTYMLKLLAVKTKNSLYQREQIARNERDTNSYEKAKQPAPGL